MNVIYIAVVLGAYITGIICGIIYEKKKNSKAWEKIGRSGGSGATTVYPGTGNTKDRATISKHW